LFVKKAHFPLLNQWDLAVVFTAENYPSARIMKAVLQPLAVFEKLMPEPSPQSTFEPPNPVEMVSAKKNPDLKQQKQY
jgi:hypothetical protein